ncbi:MAG TPA: TlpA family protein disulfide reductase [Steroidobacteraceae bacterium]|nr:TlpA family protein disulfide reductase [Steroidobacteraceae bacterium]HRX89674.1 TlpA family protein disulfide reductase [Steroidobacteraceae bacterium]
MNAGSRAPELRVARWIDGDGSPRAPLTLAELGTSVKVLYCFQHWCQGCHSVGFPTLLRLVPALEPRGVGFAVVQTVFEGFEENTFERLRETQARYQLHLPFGHDAVPEQQPTVMEDYQTGGTPWFILIDPTGELLFSDFHVDADRLIEYIGQQLG